MKVLNWTLGIVIALVALVVLGGMLVSPKFTVTRSATVKAPADKVYALLADPRRWKEWAVWNQRDPGMQITYSGPPSGSGAGWAWKSKSEGEGRMSFTTAEHGKRLGYELFFPDFGTTSTGDFVLDNAGGATKVTWTMSGDMGGNPVLRWMGLFMDSMVGKDFDAGLANLKALAEKP